MIQASLKFVVEIVRFTGVRTLTVPAEVNCGRTIIVNNNRMLKLRRSEKTVPIGTRITANVTSIQWVLAPAFRDHATAQQLIALD